MAANPCPRNAGALRALAHRLIMGCRLHEEAIGLRQNTEAVLREVTAAEAAAQFQAGKALAARDAAYRALEAADDAGRRKLLDCRLRLASKMGQRWSAAWEPTGFPDRSTAVPRTQDPRYVLLGVLWHYFTARPEHESADMGATAAACEAARTVLHDARHAATEAECAVTAAIRARRDATGALRKRCRGLILELRQLLDRADPRWAAFGLKVPASRPAQPAAKDESEKEQREIDGLDMRIIPMPEAMSHPDQHQQLAAAG